MLDGSRGPQSGAGSRRVNLGNVVFGFFVLLAATLNIGFFVGDISDPAVHDEYELFAAVMITLIATGIEFGDRTHFGAVIWRPASSRTFS